MNDDRQMSPLRFALLLLLGAASWAFFFFLFWMLP